MSRWYLDSSAALKLIITETESAELANTLHVKTPDLVASYLLETEVRRAVQRATGLSQELATVVLDSVELFEAPSSLFREAGILPGENLRSLDALHLTTAIRLGVDAVLTYDSRMTESARSLGLTVLSPR